MLSFAEVRQQFDALIKQRRVLCAVHRSIYCGNVMENTYKGFCAGFRAGADMIELDTAATTDGDYFLVHDGMEPRLLDNGGNVTQATTAEFAARKYLNTCRSVVGNPEKFIDVMPKMRGKGLINVDRSWRYWGKGLLQVMDGFGMYPQLLIKCPAEDQAALDALEQSGLPFMLMPMVRRPEDLRAVYKRKLNLVAAEILFAEEDSPLISAEFIKELKDRHIAVWINAITMSNGEAWSNISAGHDDDRAVLENADAGWGWLIDRGADIIQTDWPTMLYCYLQKRFPETRSGLFA